MIPCIKVKKKKEKTHTFKKYFFFLFSFIFFRYKDKNIMDYYHKYSVTVEDYPDEEDSEMQSSFQTMNNEASTFDYNRLNNNSGGVLDQKNSWVKK